MANEESAHAPSIRRYSDSYIVLPSRRFVKNGSLQLFSKIAVRVCLLRDTMKRKHETRTRTAIMAKTPGGILLRHIRKLLATREVPDQQLLERFIQRHDEIAFEMLVQRHGPLVLGVCRRVLHHEHDAEDAFQATFLVLAQKAGSIRKLGSVSSWLYGVANRIAAKARMNAAKRRCHEDRAESLPTVEPAEDVNWRELRSLLDEELQRLPEKYRAPLVLCYLEGKTQDEAARELDWTPGAVKGRLERGRDALRTRLSRRGVTLSVALLATVLARKATVQAALLNTTVRTATLMVAGQVESSMISVQVARLAAGATRAMLMTKVKVGAAILLVASMATVGTGMLAYGQLAAKQRQEEPSKGIAKDKGELPGTTEAGLKEGWEKSIPIPDANFGEGDTYRVWVEKGWLQAKRRTKAGQTDWHIVLARATDPEPPTIRAPNDTVTVDISYRGGRFFIRETRDVLRCVRERKRGTDGTWPRSDSLDGSYRGAGSAGGADQPPMLAGWMNDEWFVVTIGPTSERFDCLLRLNPKSERGAGYGFQGFRGDLREAFHGDTRIMDDGELLTARRGLEAVVKAKHAREAARAKLVDAPAPALDGKEWHNAVQALAWKDLRGKVVLLDFWATWCSPCVKKLPEVQALHEEFQGKGLVVIGIHSQQGGEKLAEFVREHKLSFPILLDSGKTVERFLIESFPSYMLLDKRGRVIRGASHELPKKGEIEQLLGK